MKKLIIFFIFTCTLLVPDIRDCFGQSITWERTYGHPIGSDEPNAIIQTDDEGYLIAGRNIFGLITMRLNKYGDTLWTRILPGSIATDIKKTNDGNYVVLGQFSNLTKININGDILWTVGPLNPNAGTYDIEQLLNGNYILTGSIDTLGILRKPHIIIVNSSGILISQKTFSAGFFDGSFSDLSILNSNDYVLCGSYSDVDTITDELFIMKLDSLLNTTFFVGYDTLRYHFPRSIFPVSENSYVVGGANGAFLTKIKQNGEIEWYRRYLVSECRDFTKTNDNGFAITGWWDTTGNSYDYVFLLKTDSSGNEEWRRVYGSNSNYRGNTLQQTLDSGYVIAGLDQSDMYIVKTDNYGMINSIGIEPISSVVPVYCKLYQNYPNPFNPVTKISFDIVNKNSNKVKLHILNVLGQEVVELIDVILVAGSYELEYSAKNLASGIYFYRLSINDYVETRKMMLLK